MQYDLFVFSQSSSSFCSEEFYGIPAGLSVLRGEPLLLMYDLYRRLTNNFYHWNTLLVYFVWTSIPCVHFKTAHDTILKSELPTLLTSSGLRYRKRLRTSIKRLAAWDNKSLSKLKILVCNR